MKSLVDWWKDLTEEQKILAGAIYNLREAISKDKQTLADLFALCKKNGHIIIPLDPAELNHPDPSTGAICAVCRQHFGWYCPKSPDQLCHYTRDSEWCIHCGMPSERK